MMRSLLLTLALCAGLAAAYLVEAAKPSEAIADNAPEKAAMQTVEVLVAAADLQAGAVLTAADMRWQVWPEAAANPVFIRYSARPTAAEDLSGTILRAPLRAGTPVLEDQLGHTATGFLSGVLSAGMRAVAIPVSAERTAGGFILPNNRVDVLLTLPCRDGPQCRDGVEVRTILQNVRVLAIDQSGTEAEKDAVVGKTATLELAPRDAETIIAAQAAGQLALVLRAATDEAILPPAADAAPPQAAPEAPRTVRIMRGGEVQTYDVN